MDSIVKSRPSTQVEGSVRPGDDATEFIYCIELPKEVGKRSFCAQMEALGVPTRPYFNALHLFPYMQPYSSPCPVAEMLGNRTVALPFHTQITAADVEVIWTAFVQVLHSSGTLPLHSSGAL